MLVSDSPKMIGVLVRDVGPSIVLIVIYVCIVCWLDMTYHFEQLQFPISLIGVFGTIIGLLLAFRTNSAYARWWEARALWGAIVNDSRSWTRQVLVFVKTSQADHSGNASPDSEVVRLLCLRQIAWCYALARELRRQDPLQDLSTWLPADEISVYQEQRNVANSLLLRNAEALRGLAEKISLSTYERVELERTLVRLTNAMGGCERIKNTPFPLSYSRMVHFSVYALMILLPFGLADLPVFGLMTLSLVFSLSFLAVERVAIMLQDPFSNAPSDTPMLTLARTIEINIKQMLDDDELPQPLQPRDGLLF